MAPPASSLAEEKLRSGVACIEVTILWGDVVIHTAHLTPPRSFFLGEADGKDAPCDYPLPIEKLGLPRLPVIRVDAQQTTWLTIPEGAQGTVALAGQPEQTVEQWLSDAAPHPEVAKAKIGRFAYGSKAEIKLSDITIRIEATSAANAMALDIMPPATSLLTTALSAGVHLGLITACALFLPAASYPLEDGLPCVEKERQMARYLAAAEDRAAFAREQEGAAPEAGGTSTEGLSGRSTTDPIPPSGAHEALATDRIQEVMAMNREAARRAAAQDAESFGVNDILRLYRGYDPGAPTLPWGYDNEYDLSTVMRVRTVGDDTNATFGFGAMFLSGISEEGPAWTALFGSATTDSFGRARGRFRPDMRRGGYTLFGFLGSSGRRKPRIRMTALDTRGELPHDLIQRIVRLQFGRFRLCYEDGLRNNPALRGQVAVRFLVGHDGAVSNVAHTGSDLPDSSVLSCIMKSFRIASFPQPESGFVIVTLRLALHPGD